MENVNFLELEKLEPMIIRSVTDSSILFFRIRENVVGRKSSKFSRALVSWKWCCNLKLLNENGQPLCKVFFFCWFMFIDNFILISHCLMRVLHVKALFSYKKHTVQNLVPKYVGFMVYKISLLLKSLSETYQS